MEPTPDLVRQLITQQFPAWASLPITPVAQSGWDNRTFHLGDTLSVRLPSGPAYEAQVEKEQRWLPVLSPHLPLPIPEPIAQGQPTSHFPSPWSVYRWLDGETLTFTNLHTLSSLAEDLASFLHALWRIPAQSGPPPGWHNFWRGAPLSAWPLELWRDEIQDVLPTLPSHIDVGEIERLWETALSSSWEQPPVWLHGDVANGNLLVRDGRLSAVIDFGCCAVGDPACDLVMAWTFFDAESRTVFREAVDLDQQTWERARGWALWKALLTVGQEKDQPKGVAALVVIVELLEEAREENNHASI